MTNDQLTAISASRGPVLMRRAGEQAQSLDAGVVGSGKKKDQWELVVSKRSAGLPFLEGTI
jgi:hypothetical protein